MNDTDLTVSRRFYIRRIAERARLNLELIFLDKPDNSVDEVVVVYDTRKLEYFCFHFRYSTSTRGEICDPHEEDERPSGRTFHPRRGLLCLTSHRPRRAARPPSSGQPAVSFTDDCPRLVRFAPQSYIASDQ